MHTVIEPKVFCLGAPVVLISNLNEDGSPNLMPMAAADHALSGVLQSQHTGAPIETCQRVLAPATQL
jgi:hypothetical protein